MVNLHISSEAEPQCRNGLNAAISSVRQYGTVKLSYLSSRDGTRFLLSEAMIKALVETNANYNKTYILSLS